AAATPGPRSGDLRAAMRRGDMDAAERAFAALAKRGPDAAFEDLQPLVEDDVDVHRVVLAYRAWALLDFTGREHAHSLLRQSVRSCVDAEPGRRPENQTPEKPAGSVHGDSVGVHASDAANAWRHIARVGSARTRMASLIVGAYHTAGQAGRVNNQPYPLSEQLAQVRASDP